MLVDRGAASPRNARPRPLLIDRARGGTSYRPLPKIEPSTPRVIERPSCEPTERATLLAIASPAPSRCPPRGPVVPKKKSCNCLVKPPSLSTADPGEVPDGEAPGPACFTSVLALS